jgi:integrase
MEACAVDSGSAGARDAAIFAVAILTGLRRAEIAGLDVAHYDQAAGSLTVAGKRNKTRILPVEGAACAGHDDWLDVRGSAPGPLFVRILKGGELTSDRLTTQGIYHIMQERARAGGVAHFTPHDLRRTFAGDLLDAGADIVTVQKLMGHADANTTARYDRRGEQVKRSAVRLLHLPYKRRG